MPFWRNTRKEEEVVDPVKQEAEKKVAAEAKMEAFDAQLNQLQGQLTVERERNNELQRQVSAVGAPPKETPVPAAPPYRDITDEEIQTRRGKGESDASIMKDIAKQEALREAYRLEQEQINPLRAVGMNTMDRLTDRMVSEDMPHVKSGLLKKQYEEKMAGIPVEQRMNPEAKKAVYDMIVGENIQKVIDASVEEKIRAGAIRSGGSQDASGASGREHANATLPSCAVAFGPEAAAAMAEKGYGDSPDGRDQFARSLKYSSWAEYIKEAKAVGTLRPEAVQ